MLTGLEALSLACNIMQMIGFAGGLISTFKATHRGHSPDAALAVTATQMPEAFESLSQSLARAPQPLKNDEMEMAVIAAQCLAAAAELQHHRLWLSHCQGSGGQLAVQVLVIWVDGLRSPFSLN